MEPRIVIDTCVLVVALRSRRGASFRIVSLVGRGHFEFCLSVPLVVEYEAAAKRHSRKLGLTYEDIEDVLDYLCRVGIHREVHFLWRPCLRDPGDDLVLELAVESESTYLVTHNVRDFTGAEKFDINVINPKEFLRVIGELSP